MLSFDRGDALTVANDISGTGAVTKLGAGTTTLTGSNSYSGNTTVNSGTLENTSAFLADAADVSIAASAVLKLSFSGTDTVHALTIAGAAKPPGTYGATGSGASHIDNTHFSGTGTLTVTSGPTSAFAAWASLKGLIPGVNDGPTQDPDNDGISNLLEFVLGGDPLASDPSILPVAVLTPTDNTDVPIWILANRMDSGARACHQFAGRCQWCDCRCESGQPDDQPRRDYGDGSPLPGTWRHALRSPRCGEMSDQGGTDCARWIVSLPTHSP